MFFFFEQQNPERIEAIKSNSLKENPKRSIYIDDKIDCTLFKKLAKEIQLLRMESADPITVYLDSPGGSLEYSEKILNLLRAPRHDFKSCLINTVVHSSCGSAASIFLTQGDYVMAYPNATIHFHGILYPYTENLNVEIAELYSNSLTRLNDQVAFQILNKISERLIKRVMNLTIGKNFLSDYLNYLKTTLSSNNYLIVSTVFSKLQTQASINNSLFKIINSSETQLEKEIKIFNAVLKRLLNIEKKSVNVNELLYSEDLISRAKIHARTLIALTDERYHDLLLNRKVLMSKHPDFTPINYPKHKEEQVREEMNKRIETFCDELYFYGIAFCRSLFESEYNFSSYEAYSLGIIDEIVGDEPINDKQYINNINAFTSIATD